jgi:hypothetical protein
MYNESVIYNESVSARSDARIVLSCVVACSKCCADLEVYPLSANNFQITHDKLNAEMKIYNSY